MSRKTIKQQKSQSLPGLTPGIRMKGGVRYDPAVKGYVAIVHSWDNALGLGEAQEWRSPQVFPTEDSAMEYYKTSIRPALEQMASQVAKQNIIHRKLEQ
jgi:hypothetical protein